MHTAADMQRMMEVLALRACDCVRTRGTSTCGSKTRCRGGSAHQWTVHFHVKDYVQPVLDGPAEPGGDSVNLGEGEVDHVGVLEHLRNAGYSGVLALEPHCVEAIAPGLSTLNGWIAGWSSSPSRRPYPFATRHSPFTAVRRSPPAPEPPFGLEGRGSGGEEPSPSRRPSPRLSAVCGKRPAGTPRGSRG